MKTRVYSSTNNYSIKQVLIDSIKGYKTSFYLAKQLAKRDITSQYRQSLLGFLWALLPIIMNALVWIFLQSTGTIRLSDTGVPYPLYVLVGTTIWSILVECLNMPTNSVNANKSIVTKINFEKEALITLGVLKMGFNLLIKLGLIVFFILYFKVLPTNTILLFLPLLLLVVLAFTALGVMIVPIGMLYKDIGKAIPIAMQLLMYVTPVLYAMPKTGFMYQIMRLNPLSYVITDIRNTITGLPLEHGLFWCFFTVATMVLIILALVVYRVSIPIVTERMSA